MKNYPYLAIVILLISSYCFGQDHVLPLWQKNIPNYRVTEETEVSDTTDVVRISNVQTPDISVYLPAKKSSVGRAVVICPGGGYRILAYDWEGSDIAKWLNSKGIAGIVLKYRLPLSKSNIVNHKSPLLDVQRAIRLTRYHADDWNIERDNIGVMGFSAGGHLASTAGTHFDSGHADAGDPVECMSSRPDFMILIYPVITFSHDYMHKGSRKALIGENPGSTLIEYYSNELHVTSDTPPTFIIHAGDDKSVPVENSLLFYHSLVEKDVPAECHIYPEGGHGFSLAVGKGHLSTWTDRCIDWLNWLNSRAVD